MEWVIVGGPDEDVSLDVKKENGQHKDSAQSIV